MAQSRWVYAVYAAFSGPARIRRKRALHGAGVCNMPPPSPSRIRGRARKIFRKYRYFPENFRIPHMARARWVCAVYADFSRSSGIRRKRPLLGAGVWNMRLTGSDVKHIGSSGNLAIPHRSSASVSWIHHGGFVPFTRISLDLPEFGDNGP